MKLRKVTIQHFKSIESLEIDFTDIYSGQPRPMTVLFGDNGSGKTSVLQAIALVISLATRKTRNPESLHWHGFLANRVDPAGRTRIVVTLEMSDEELQHVHDLYEIWKQHIKPEKPVTPSRNRIITLVYENGEVYAEGGPADKFALLGRYYARSLFWKRVPRILGYYEKVGDIFWFDQYRNLGSGVSILEEQEDQDTKEAKVLPRKQVNWQAGVEGLRKKLVGWRFRSTVPTLTHEADYIQRLELSFSHIFPGASLADVVPMHEMASENEDYYFMLERNNKQYDISEMSSGEQAVFCILFEFINMQIAHSIILIDELELHLHPPEQQAMYSSLSKLGKDCQYIITSHSSHLRDIVPEECIVRLKGGKLCL